MAVRDNRTPFDGGPDATPVEDEVLAILEKHDIPTAVNDRIMDLIRQSLAETYAREHPEPEDALSEPSP